MDPQPRDKYVFRMRAKPSPLPKESELTVDISDDLPPQTLIYRNDQDTISAALDFL